jgi:hypothetical protein
MYIVFACPLLRPRNTRASAVTSCYYVAQRGVAFTINSCLSKLKPYSKDTLCRIVKYLPEEQKVEWYPKFRGTGQLGRTSFFV